MPGSTRRIIRQCGCGHAVRLPADDIGCLICDRPCCPACTYQPEGAVYCGPCARKHLGVGPEPEAERVRLVATPRYLVLRPRTLPRIPAAAS